MKVRMMCLVLIAVLAPPFPAAGGTVTKVDFTQVAGVEINAAGPLFVLIDEARNRLIAANTLTSSLSLVDAGTGTVTNIPLAGRTLQHLKAEALTLRRRTGDIYLIGTGCFHIVDVTARSAVTVAAGVQFESITVCEESGNVFLSGRESTALGFYDAAAGELKMVPWLESSEELINLNQTPPPPVRKVIADNSLGRLIAVDGLASTLYLFDAASGALVRSRPVPLASGGRWHLAGYNEETHALYIVTETAKRKVMEAARIGIADDTDMVVALPGFTEGVGIIYHAGRDEIYIPYDNHPSVHVVDFSARGSVTEIALPTFGNDASAIDSENDVLFIGSWAKGEVDLVDLKERTLLKRITGLGIIPHMFTMAYNPNNGRVYFPKGASAVNGTFGAAITALDPVSEQTTKIYAGWAPIELITVPARHSVLVFNNEDQFAEVKADGSYQLHRLPFDYPVSAVTSPGGNVYLSYGPHQSYWPVVYIWGAKNGILTIESGDLGFYDRRIPRQAHKMVLGGDGTLYFTQNNWGREQQFIGTLEDEVRLYDAGRRVAVSDTVQREITQRILEYDANNGRLYLVRVGEEDSDPSILQVIDPKEKKILHSIPVGVTATDLLFDDAAIYVANFDSKTVSVIDKETWLVRDVDVTHDYPVKLCFHGDNVYVVSHTEGIALQQVTGAEQVYEYAAGITPTALFEWQGSLIVGGHGPAAFELYVFDAEQESFTLLHSNGYPYGETRYDSRNVSFYVRGQYGDVVFDLTRQVIDSDGRLWVSDFLSGSLFILER